MPPQDNTRLNTGTTKKSTKAQSKVEESTETEDFKPQPNKTGKPERNLSPDDKVLVYPELTTSTAPTTTTATPTAIARRGIARTFQTPQLPDGLTVHEAVATAAANIGNTANKASSISARATTAIATCGLTRIADARCGTLPHGLRRRVEIARALAGAPHILVLDEPAAGLAPPEQAEIAEILRTLAASGLAVLVIDHNIEFLRPLATRLACLDAGRLIADGPLDEVLADDTVQNAYFGLVQQ